MKIPSLAAKIKTTVLIAGCLLGVYAMLGYYVLPTLLKSKLPELIRQQTGRKASLATVRFDPFSFRLSLRGFELQDPDARRFVGFDDFFIELNARQSIGQAALIIDKISLHKPSIRIARNKNGSFNFNDLIKDSHETQTDKAKIFPVNIVKLSISEGKLDWEDAHFKSPEQETVYPINLLIENLTAQTDRQSKLSLSLELSSGGKLDWQGALNLKPFSSSGHLKLDNVQLSRLQALALQDVIQADLHGHARFEADYKTDYSGDKFNLNVNQGKIELRDLQVSLTPQDKAPLKIPYVAVRGIAFNLDRHELTIESLAAKDANLKAWLNSDGTLNYQALLPTAKTEPVLAPAQAIPWSIQINTVAVDNFGLTFEDRTLKNPVTLSAKPIRFKLTNFTNKAGANLPFQLSVGFNKNGLITLDGNTVIEPLSAQIAVNAKEIALEDFQTYVDNFARLDVIDGRLAIDGKISVAKSAQDKLELKFTGNSEIADFLTRDQLKNKDFIKWDNLTLSGIDVEMPANRYSAETLLIDKPYARVVIRKDKTVNFSDIIIKSPPALLPQNKERTQDRPPSLPKEDNEAQKPIFKLGNIQIVDGSTDFSDLSLILPFAAQIKSLDGGAGGLSSEQKATVTFDLKGNAYDLSPVDIKGEIRPYQGDYNVAVNFTGMPMPLISSYMVQFAGYKVEKGKMSLELNYKVAHKELTATNNILIDRFELGEKVENPNAVSLPLELAVSLMKDSEGKIKLHVPISGSLEDPQFSVTHLIGDAIANAIGKVITSPFRALASLIGSEEDLSTVSFPAGSAELNQQQIRKLDDLAKALKARPVLKLEIKGAAFQQQDWPAVSDDALYDQLKRIKADEINKKGGRKIRPEYVVISDQDYRRLMEQLFVEKLPLLVEKPLLGTLRLVDTKADTNTDEFYAVAKEKLSAIIKPEEQRLKDLAAERARAIANYIVQKGGIANERIFILDTAIDPNRENAEIVTQLSLKAD